MASVPFAFNAGQVAGLSVMESASSGSNASTSATLKLGSATTPVAFDLGQYGLTLQTSGTTSLKLPTSGTVLTYLDSATSGTISSITSAGGQSGSEVGLGITLATANTNIQYGIQFNLSGTGTGGNQSYDLYGTGGLWKISNTGVLNVASCVGCGGGGTNYWNLVSGANGGYISPINSTADLLIGSQATTSAAFAVIGLASSLHQTIASVSGNFFVMSNNGFGGSVGVGTNNPVPGAANALEVTGKIKTDTQLWAAGSSTGDLPAALYENFDNSATDVNGISFQVKLTNPTTSTTIMGVDWHKENGWSTTSSTNNADLILNTFSNATALEVGRFLANGNFGLQTAAPTALLDVNGAASVGGQLTFRSSFGTIQTTADQQLTLGGNTTGKILLSAFNGQTVTVGTTGAIVFGGYNSCTLKTDGSGNLRCDTDLTSAGTASPFAEITGANGGYIRAGNLTEDFLLGGSSTTSAKFAILNLNSGIPTATISGNMIVMPYTSGGNELGGFLGIGTTNPLATLTDIGTALFQTPIASSAAFQIQNSAGAPVFLVDTTNTTNLLTNPGFETGITGWSTRGTSTISKNTNKKNIYAGQASLLMGTSTANSGASTNGFTAILGAGTYTLSFNAMLGSGTLTTLNVGYNQGASDVPCTLNSNAVKTTGFQRYTCTFTTSGNLSYIYIDDGTGASLISLFIDAVQLEQNGFASPYTIGAIQLRGLINSPVAIQPLSDSTSVFQIQNSNGNNNLFVADSLDNAIGIGTNAPLATLDVRALNGINPVASISGSTSFASLVIDQAGAGELLTASDSGATRFVLRQNGSVSLGSGSLANAGYTLDVLGSARIGSSNTPGDDILKQTTSDFTVASGGSGGATAYSVTTNDSAQTVSTANNQLSLVTDLLSAAGVSIPTPAGQGPATGQAIGGGAVAAQRPDSTFIVISGNGSNTTRIYDPVQNAFLTGPTLTTTANTGTQIFQRQNGKFVIIPAGGTTGVSNIYDPAGSVNIGTIRAGPPLAGAYQIGAGSQVIRRSDGKFMIIMGNNTAGTMIYDPTATTSAAPNADIGNFNVGPNVSGNVQAGSFAFETIYGKWVIGLGTSQSTSIYDPSTGLFTAGPTWTSVYAVNSGAGAHVIQRPDYKYEIILGGGSANTIVYDPTTNAFSAGPSLQGAGVASTGAHSFQRSNGTWATVLGGSSANNTVEFYDPNGNSGAGTYSASTGTLYTGYNTGAGALTFQRPDGKYVVLTGGTATTSTIYDAGWNTTGTWISEGVASSKISTYSALLWTGDPQSANNNARLDKSTTDVFVRTAISGGTLANSTWVNVNNSGDLIQAVSGAAMAQIQVTFNAPVRSYPQLVTSEINQSNIWPGEGSTFNRRSFLQPSIYSLRISDPMVQYGGGVLGGEQYGRNFATAGAVLEGVVTTNTNQLTLNVNRNLPTASPAAGVIIASASANLGASAAAGSFTLQLPTGKFLVIIGGSTTTRLYDPDSNTFSTGPTLPTGNAAIGAHGFQLPDGRFFVVQGGNNTSIYDPVANVFSKGPNIMTGAGTGALSGANSMQLPDGRYLIILANQKDTNIYDPFLNQMTQGPYLTAAATAGGMHVIRPDGRVLIFLGGSVNTNIYDAATNAFLAGPSAVGTVALGSTVAQLANGRIIYTIGGAKTIYYLDINGTTETTATAVTVTATVAANWGAGAAWIPRPDGKLLLIGGGANASIYIYDPVINTLNGSAVATALLPCAVGAGGHVFQRPDGTYMLICGGATPTVTVVLDAGLNLG